MARDSGFQFDPTAFTPMKVPEWLAYVAKGIAFIEPALKWIFWGGLAVLAALILYAIVREILRLRAPTAKPAKAVVLDEPPWRPDSGAARDLLAAADELAARGLFMEAAHLILLRSVQDIEKRRPRAVGVSLTAREIAALPALPEAARPAFVGIARLVERALFGGRPVDAADYAACRGAYEAFALPEGWRG
nr:DUF4129 domain-containing protein [Caulobacter hibisci]